MRDFILYGLAVGLNRGSLFILLPVLALVMSVDKFGSLSIYLILVQLLVPFVSLNITSIVGREIYEKPKLTFYFVSTANNVLCFVFLIGGGLFAASQWIGFLILAYAALEGLVLVNLTYIRFISGAYSFFKVTLQKFLLTLIFFSGIYFFNKLYLDNVEFVVIVFMTTCVVILPSFLRFSSLTNIKRIIYKLSYVKRNAYLLVFSLTLIPHILAQWITASSDRFFVEHYLGLEQLGVYSLAYSIASVYMLFNSALALGMPQICVKDYQGFIRKKFRLVYFVITLVAFFLFIGSVVVILPVMYSDSGYNVEELRSLILVIASGFYLLSFYYYHSSILFYHRRVKLLSVATALTAVINVALVFWLIKDYGLLAVAMVTYVSYLFYFVFVAVFSSEKTYLFNILIIVASVVAPIYIYLNGLAYV